MNKKIAVIFLGFSLLTMPLRASIFSQGSRVRIGLRILGATGFAALASERCLGAINRFKFLAFAKPTEYASSIPLRDGLINLSLATL